MLYSELVTAVAQKTGLRKSQVKDMVDALSEVVISGVKKDGLVALGPLGQFQKKRRQSRNIKDLRTGQVITTKERDYPLFKPSLPFRREVADE